jgi:hypothetical protein
MDVPNISRAQNTSAEGSRVEKLILRLLDSNQASVRRDTV